MNTELKAALADVVTAVECIDVERTEIEELFDMPATSIEERKAYAMAAIERLVKTISSI